MRAIQQSTCSSRVFSAFQVRRLTTGRRRRGAFAFVTLPVLMLTSLVRAQTFLDVTLYPAGVAVGDFNGDGKQDLVTADPVDGTLSVFLGNGNGTFQPRLVLSAFSADPDAVAVGDFNGDGKADLATGNGVGQIVGVFLG